MSKQDIYIKNRRAYFDYEILEKYTAGMQLLGTEIKSVREGKVSLGEGFCTFRKEELFVRNVTIAEYELGNINNHEPTRARKLLLHKRELRKLEAKIKEKGLTIIPLAMFISEKGYAKLEIGLAKGKKTHDKRHSIKEKDVKREMDKALKNYR